MKFNKEKILQPNTVVHCKTLEQASELLHWADGVDLTWTNEHEYLFSTGWNSFKETSCYNMNTGARLSYQFAKARGYNILKFEDIVIDEDSIISMNKKYKTRRNKDVRILTIDKKDEKYPIVALITNKDETESICGYTSTGNYYFDKTISHRDLIEIEPIPDKALVKCWNDDRDFIRYKSFYDALNKCTFSYDYTRNGTKFNNYEIIDPEPGWATEARKQLKD